MTLQKFVRFGFALSIAASPTLPAAQENDFHSFFKQCGIINYVRHDGGDSANPRVTWRTVLAGATLPAELTDTEYIFQCSTKTKVAQVPKPAIPYPMLNFEDVIERNQDFIKYLATRSSQEAEDAKSIPNSVHALAAVACQGRENTRAVAAAVTHSAGLENVIRLECEIDLIARKSNPMLFTANFTENPGYLQFREEWITLSLLFQCVNQHDFVGFQSFPVWQPSC